MEPFGSIVNRELERLGRSLPALPMRASASDERGGSGPSIPEPGLEERKAQARLALTEYAERLEREKAERAESGGRRRSDREEKAIELLVEGAVGIIAEGRLEADVVGDSDVYRVAWSEGDGWSCSCPGAGFRRRCSHQLAVMRASKLVTSEVES
jgi:hypothetical protein